MVMPKTSYKDDEFNRLIWPIIQNEEYQKTKFCTHHGLNRYDHMVRVAYYSYKITKVLHLNYQEATKGAVLHDFFFNEEEKNKIVRLVEHPEMAYLNASKYFDLSDLEEDIIRTHMFPIGKKVPKYLESWIVDLVDDVASIYEKSFMIKVNMKLSFNLMVMLLVMFRR